MRYFIEHSYNGTGYSGWQTQPNAMTIQEMLEQKLQVLLREPVRLTGSSRTDTGVHALQQYAHFDTEAIPEDDLPQVTFRLNALLPPDIAVQRLIPVPDRLHARFAATHRKYEYRIIRRKDPFLTGQAYLFRPLLDLESMNKAAALLLRHSDFQSFSKIHTDVKTFRCDVTQAVWETRGSLLLFRIRSDRFLRGMVRAIVGTLLEVGLGKRSVTDFEQLILAKNRKKAGPQAPPCGLFLVEVGYREEDLRRSDAAM